MMKNRKSVRTLAAILMVMLLVATVFTGCNDNKANSSNSATSTSEGQSSADTADTSNQDNVSDAGYVLDPNTPAWQLDNERPATVTWYVNAEWWNTDFGNDFVSKKIIEDTNITIAFSVGDDTKLNTLFASDDLPDIVTIFNGTSQIAVSAPSWAYSLNELADKYDPYFYKVASEDTLNWYKLSDGNTYGYPNYSNSQKDFDDDLITAGTAFTIRKDIYDALGQPSMKTQEEFLDVFGQIKEKYPDLLTFGWFSDIDGGFQNYIGVPIEDADGNFYDRNMDEDYLSWVSTFNQAYRNGYITDDNFTSDQTLFQEKVQTGKYACLFLSNVPHLANDLQVWMTSNPDAQYYAIDGPESTVGNAPTLSQAGISGWMLHYISKTCEAPEKAIQLFTYLQSEHGQLVTYYGVEGETYEVNEEGKLQFMPEIENLMNNDYDTLRSDYRFAGEFYLFGHSRYIDMGAYQNPAISQMEKWGEGKLKPQFLIEATSPDGGSAEARNNTNIETEWKTTLASLMRANSDDDFNQIVEDFKKFRTDNGWDAIMEIRNEKMRQNREKLGLD